MTFLTPDFLSPDQEVADRPTCTQILNINYINKRARKLLRNPEYDGIEVPAATPSRRHGSSSSSSRFSALAGNGGCVCGGGGVCVGMRARARGCVCVCVDGICRCLLAHCRYRR